MVCSLHVIVLVNAPGGIFMDRVYLQVIYFWHFCMTHYKWYSIMDNHANDYIAIKTILTSFALNLSNTNLFYLCYNLYRIDVGKELDGNKQREGEVENGSEWKGVKGTSILDQPPRVGQEISFPSHSQCIVDSKFSSLPSPPPWKFLTVPSNVLKKIQC